MDNSNDFATGVMLGENRNGNGWGSGFGNEGLWLFAILALMGGGFGNWGGNRNGDAVTEAALCNANSFSELKGSVGRLSDQVANMYTGLQNGLCNLGYTLLENFNSIERVIQNCCCEAKQILLENRYLAEKNAADTNATIIAQVQSVKDMLCQQEAARKDARIWQLELGQALCGVPRFQPGTVYGSIPVNPFFGGFGGGCGTCYGQGNI